MEESTDEESEGKMIPITNIKKRDGKYLWSDIEWKNYCERESTKIKGEFGIPMNTRIITRLVYDKVIVPNQIQISDLIRPDIKINKRIWKQRLI